MTGVQTCALPIYPKRRQRSGDSGYPEEWPARSGSKPARVNRIGPSTPSARRVFRPATDLGFVLVQLDVSIVNIALAKIGADLGTTVAGLQWVVDSYALAFAALLLSAGALGDQIGARKGFIVGFAAFVAASLWQLVLF